MDKSDIFSAGIATGLLFLMGLNLATGPKLIDKIKVFPRENQPSVMRIYKPGKDGIYVEDPNKQEYTPLSTYLDTFKNESDRIIEAEQIKKTIGWYK